MSSTLSQPRLPRPLVYLGVPALAGLVVVALWAWMNWGMAVFFDVVESGLGTCL